MVRNEPIPDLPLHSLEVVDFLNAYLKRNDLEVRIPTTMVQMRNLNCDFIREKPIVTQPDNSSNPFTIRVVNLIVVDHSSVDFVRFEFTTRRPRIHYDVVFDNCEFSNLTCVDYEFKK